MQLETLAKSVLQAGVVAILVILTVLLLEEGENPGIPRPTAEHSDAPGVPSAVETAAPSREDAAARVPISTSPSDEGARAPSDAGVRGEVRDASGRPLAGVRITTRLLEAPREVTAPSPTTTDAQGSFTLAMSPGALAELAFSLSGYRPSRKSVRAPSSEVEVVLERSPPLRGRVVRDDGTPVGDALVRWSNPHLAPGSVETAMTGTDGRFAFLDVPWGLDLEILAPDTLPVYRSVRVTWGMGELVVTVDGGRKATGTVLDMESGAGIAGASVALWYYRSTYTAEGRRGGPAQHAETVTTRADGSFTLTKLPSASDKTRPSAWLWVTAPGRAPHWKIVPSPERADGFEIGLHAAGSVRGRVVDASGAPLPGQRVYAEARVQPLCDAGPDHAFRRQDGGYSSVMWSTRRPEAVAPFHTEREAFTDSAGEYVIDRIPCPAGGGEVTITLPAGRQRVTVVARPGEVAVAEDLARPEGLFRRWHGVVRDEEAPVAGAVVELGTARTMSDSRGRFDLDVPANLQGKLTLRANAPGYIPFQQVIVPSRGMFAECDDGGMTIKLARGTSLAVRVVDRFQRPVPNASVQVFPEGGLAEFTKGGPRPSPLCRGRSDDRGAVRLADVPPTFDALIESPRPHTPKHTKVLEAVAGTLKVVLEDFDRSAGTATLILRVIDGRTEAPVTGQVLVEATSEKGSTRNLTRGPETLGKWELSMTAEGMGVRTTGVELFGDRRIDVRLGEGAAISGQVTSAVGSLARPVQVQARKLASNSVSVTYTDTEGRFELAGMESGEYLLSVEPFENTGFTFPSMRIAQGHTSTESVKVRVAPGATPAPVILPVVPVAPLRVVVAPDADTRASRNVWSWAQGLHFAVSDEQGASVYTGGPSNVMTAAAEILLCLPKGRYTVIVRRRGEVLGQRKLAAGEDWRLDTR